MLICNDYEYELIRQKTGLEAAGILQHSEAVIVTRGEKGSTIWTKDADTRSPRCRRRRKPIPPGVGDAFRGGLLRGLALGVGYQVSAQIGSVAAAYVLEQMGAQSHRFSWEEFSQRYERHFGPIVLPV